MDHLCSLTQSVVLCSFGNSNKSRTAAHFKGYIHFNSPIYHNNNLQDYNKAIHINSNNIYEAFNNNAIEANYMSKDLFLDIKNRLHKNLYRQQKSNVALADDSKAITSFHVVTLPLTVIDDNQNKNSMNNGLYVVVNMKDNDIIVGLPAIMTSFWEFFKKEIDHQIDKRNMCSLNTTSEVPKIVRWRINLQSFSFKIRHIKGTENIVADALSRPLILDHPPPSSDEYDGYSLNCLDAYDWNSSDTPLCSVFSPTYSPPELQVLLPNSSPTQIVPVPTGRNREREKSGITADQHW